MPGPEASRWIAAWAMQIIETVLILAIFLRLAWARDREGPPALESGFRRLAQRKALCVVLTGVSVLGTRAALVPLLGVPAAEWHDEFSYLLAADTFAHGRLTNPPHPLWRHFETFHVIQQPTYMSMYAPAQGLVLAVGEKLGNPWIGQMLATAALCAALCWMLQGWFSAEWALWGALVAGLRIGILSYWMNSYWSASVVGLGGALVIGAWGRLRQRATWRDAVIFALGLMVLANSRPYEGLLVSLPFLLAFGVGACRAARGDLRRSLVPALLVLLAGFSAMGYYYSRVTGSPLRMTYEVNRGQYAMAPYFLWQRLRPEPYYRHAVMRDFYRWEVGQFLEYRTWAGFWYRTGEKLLAAWSFYLGPLLTIPLLVLPWVARERRLRIVMLSGTCLIAGVLVSTFFLPHYLAPGTGLLYIVLVAGMQKVAGWRRAPGRRLAAALPAIAAIMIGLRLTLIAMHSPLEPRWPRGNLERGGVERELEKSPGQHVVLVEYSPGHNPDHEWVYNLADVDSQKVVWARDMGAENDELLRYYHGRTVWRVDGDDRPVRLERGR